VVFDDDVHYCMICMYKVCIFWGKALCVFPVENECVCGLATKKLEKEIIERKESDNDEK